MIINTLKQRALIKTITWRIVASATTFILALFVFSNEPNATQKVIYICIAETLINVVMYYYHERFWQRIKIYDTEINDNVLHIQTPVVVSKAHKDVMTIKREEFIITHKSLIKAAKEENNHTGRYGRSLVLLARTEIGYSSNASACDIHRTLIMSI